MTQRKYNTEEERKEANRRHQSEYRKAHVDQIRKRNLRWMKNNPEKTRKWSQQWNEKNPEKRRELNRRKTLQKFGLTLEQYQAMLERQKGVCGICGKENPSGGNLAVDHNHVTGKTRGLLCGTCNTALHKLEKDRDWATRAIGYLDKFD